MSNSEIAKLCQKIYKQHRQALDLIYEHRPDLQSKIFTFVKQLIQEDLQKSVEIDDCNKRYIRFAPKEWDELQIQKNCQNWTKSNRRILFEFVNEPQYLGLHLVIGPGDYETKKMIFDALGHYNNLHKECKLKETGWSHIFKKIILHSSNYVDEDLDNIEEVIKSFWQRYCDDELDKIRKIIFNLGSEQL